MSPPMSVTHPHKCSTSLRQTDISTSPPPCVSLPHWCVAPPPGARSEGTWSSQVAEVSLHAKRTMWKQINNLKANDLFSRSLSTTLTGFQKPLRLQIARSYLELGHAERRKDGWRVRIQNCCWYLFKMPRFNYMYTPGCLYHDTNYGRMDNIWLAGNVAVTNCETIHNGRTENG